eukprot:m.420653 g.420653  ORF g.420653 m.420653 type:complete len:323 (-) comp32706_c0_seq1:137-1105(-)
MVSPANCRSSHRTRHGHIAARTLPTSLLATALGIAVLWASESAAAVECDGRPDCLYCLQPNDRCVQDHKFVVLQSGAICNCVADPSQCTTVDLVAGSTVASCAGVCAATANCSIFSVDFSSGSAQCILSVWTLATCRERASVTVRVPVGANPTSGIYAALHDSEIELPFMQRWRGSISSTTLYVMTILSVYIISTKPLAPSARASFRRIAAKRRAREEASEALRAYQPRRGSAPTLFNPAFDEVEPSSPSRPIPGLLRSTNSVRKAATFALACSENAATSGETPALGTMHGQQRHPSGRGNSQVGMRRSTDQLGEIRQTTYL